jgi:hypothetical protein
MTGWNGRRLSEEGKGTSPESMVLLAIVPSLRHRYLIVRHENRGLELSHLFLNSGEEVLPVFSSVEVASRFLSSVVFGEGWYVREFSAGELVSVLFSLGEGIKQVLLNPLPEALVGDEGLVSFLVDRDGFIESLIES